VDERQHRDYTPVQHLKPRIPGVATAGHGTRGPDAVP
jgi:hypothetical protein